MKRCRYRKNRKGKNDRKKRIMSHRFGGTLSKRKKERERWKGVIRYGMRAWNGFLFLFEIARIGLKEIRITSFVFWRLGEKRLNRYRHVKLIFTFHYSCRGYNYISLFKIQFVNMYRDGMKRSVYAFNIVPLSIETVKRCWHFNHSFHSKLSPVIYYS